jgi:hypothetical protein
MGGKPEPAPKDNAGLKLLALVQAWGPLDQVFILVKVS